MQIIKFVSLEVKCWSALNYCKMLIWPFNALLKIPPYYPHDYQSLWSLQHQDFVQDLATEMEPGKGTNDLNIMWANEILGWKRLAPVFVSCFPQSPDKIETGITRILVLLK